MEKAITEIARTETAGDRLSSLPDDIISHILSFLQTKYAVGTAVLSWRWKDLWTRVSNLDFDNRLLSQSLYGKVAHRSSLFCRFVNNVLSRHKNLDSVRRFRFHCLVWHRFLEPSEARFERELAFGALVEEIDVMLWGDLEFRIPESFHSLENLKVAKLSGVVLDSIQGSVFLPSMKILELSSVKTKDVESLGRLISGCPVLETLHLENCCHSSSNEKCIIEASSPSLKSLRIICGSVVIKAPNLEDLYLGEVAQVKFKDSSSPLSCLHSADVDLDAARISSYRDLIELLTAISNAKKIGLSGMLLTRLSYVDDVRFPVFPNLAHLEIGIGGRSLVLHSLLNSASKLQSLVINLRSPRGSMSWERLETVRTPECLFSSLEVIDIKDLVKFGDEWKMIAYLVGAGAVLKKVNMHLYSRDHEVKGRRGFALLRRQSRGPSHWEARLILPNNQEILIDDETRIDDDDDDGCDYFDDGIDDETDNVGYN